MLGLAKQWKRILKENGSLFLNLAQVNNPKSPTLSLYQEKLLMALVEEEGYSYAGRWYWHNPSKIPAGHWVTHDRSRLKNGVEEIYWLSKTDKPKANNRNVLIPYGEGMKKTIEKGGDSRKIRPSGHGGVRNTSFARSNGGSIPSNLIRSVPKTTQNDPYQKYCLSQNLPIHPGRFPSDLPEFAINLTTDIGDLVYDPLSGSNTTGAAAEKLHRYWISSEMALQYVLGGMGRFVN